jgi:multimeric flavodoxin WrbA
MVKSILIQPYLLEEATVLKNILAIIGSPRTLGNCEIMAKEISRCITEPHNLNLLRLPEYDIRPCIGCYSCLYKNECVIDDDFRSAVQAMVEADALILAVPTYFLGPNACMKRFTDRGIALYPYLEKLYAKPAVAVGIAGIEGKEGYTMLGLESFLKMIFADLKMRRIVYGALPGEVFLNQKNRDTAAGMARALFGEPEIDKAPCCPVCGGQTFRFMKDNQVRCMLCSNAGRMVVENGRPVFEIPRSEHELFLSLEEALKHREWLVGMKSRFKANKDHLKEICLDYRHAGRWVKPSPNNNGPNIS